MPSIISAGTSVGTSLNLQGDTSGVLELQTNNGTPALTLESNGNITIPGTGKRILGDFSNATVANRVAFQTSTTNGNTIVSLIPNGTATIAQFQAFGGSDVDNTSQVQFANVTNNAVIAANRTGTGTFGNILFNTGGSERLRIDTSGNVGIGTSSPSGRLHVATTGAASNLFVTSDISTSALASRISLGNSTGAARFTIGLLGTAGESAYLGSEGNFPLTFQTNGTERMRLDSSGNLGLGVTPSAWGSTFKAYQTGLGAAFAGRASNITQAFMGANWFNDGTAKYIGTGESTLYQMTTGQHQWLVAPSGTAGNAISYTQAMTLDASGNLGIGTTTTSTGKLIAGLGGGHTFNVEANGVTLGSNNGVLITNYLSQTTRVAGINLAASASNAGEIVFGTASSGTLSERMRIDSSGNLCVGITTAQGLARFYRTTSGDVITAQNTDNGAHANFVSRRAGTSGQAVYFDCAGNQAGTITHPTTTSTNYGSGSDYRLKDNIQPLTNALNTVSQLKPSKWIWKTDGSEDSGFIAHELQELFPSAVTGTKDEVDEEGKPIYQCVDTSFLVATLTAAIQELNAKVDALQTELNTLKGV